MNTEATNKKAPFTIEWREGFKVDIAQIDQEHQQLFALIKSLDLGTVEEAVDVLLVYIVTHFSNEQEWMEKSGYPDLEPHLLQHKEFAEQVVALAENKQPWNEDRVQVLRRFLNRWLIGHIMLHDLSFGKWYEKHKLPIASTVKASTKLRADTARMSD